MTYFLSFFVGVLSSIAAEHFAVAVGHVLSRMGHNWSRRFALHGEWVGVAKFEQGRLAGKSLDVTYYLKARFLFIHGYCLFGTPVLTPGAAPDPNQKSKAWLFGRFKSRDFLILESKHATGITALGTIFLKLGNEPTTLTGYSIGWAKDENIALYCCSLELTKRD